MTTSTGQRHQWTPDDDVRLNIAVTALAAANLRGGVRIWHAVAGRLAPELCVSPDAARSRYEKLQAARKEEAERLAAEYEKTQRESNWQATIERWATQWDDCPCGEMLPDAADETTVICRHCGRTWHYGLEATGVGTKTYSWRLDFDTAAKAESEENWARTMRIVEQYEDDADTFLDSAIMGLRDEVAALSHSLRLGLKAIQDDHVEILTRLVELKSMWQ